MELISIIVPVYNGEIYIGRCLDSILEQTYQNLEIIIIDDGSSDRTGDICEKYLLEDRRIKYFYQENRGQSVARNNGVLRCTGDWIAFLDSDDVYLPYSIEVMYNIQKATNADIVLTSIGNFNNTYNTSINSQYLKEIKLYTLEVALEEMYYGKTYGVSPLAKLYPRSNLLSNPYPEGKIHEDMDTTFKLISCASKIAVCDIVTAVVYFSDNSTTRTKFNERMLYFFKAIQNNIVFINLNFPHNTSLISAVIYNEVFGGIDICGKMIDFKLYDTVDYYRKKYRKYFKTILFNNRISVKEKVKYILFISSIRYFTIVRKIYNLRLSRNG
ncbi:TPA: glycosyltransferase family 2 protein [Streptococcus agalactiae]|nr:glycosyltransferase family 2 protein [Streptococcus agalactiae]